MPLDPRDESEPVNTPLRTDEPDDKLRSLEARLINAQNETADLRNAYNALRADVQRLQTQIAQTDARIK